MLKRELTVFEKYAIMGLLLAVCLYFYIGKIYSPVYNNLKETKIKLNAITSEVDGLGSRDELELQNAEAERELELTQFEASEVKFDLDELEFTKKSQTIGSAMDTLVEVNRLSLKNRVKVNTIALSGATIEKKLAEGENSENEDYEEVEEQLEEVLDAEVEIEDNGEGEVNESGLEDLELAEGSVAKSSSPLNSYKWEIYDVHFQGSYNNSTNFVDSLKNTSKIVRIDYVDFKYTGENDNYSVYIKIYI